MSYIAISLLIVSAGIPILFVCKQHYPTSPDPQLSFSFLFLLFSFSFPFLFLFFFFRMFHDAAL